MQGLWTATLAGTACTAATNLTSLQTGQSNLEFGRLVQASQHGVTIDTAKHHIHSISIECYAGKVQSANMSRVPLIY